MNSIIEQAFKSAEPTVGMPATFMSFSDRNPGTVAKILSKKKIIVIHCDSYAVGGPYNYGDYITYEYTPGTLAEIIAKGEAAANDDNEYGVYTLRKNGRWVRKGVEMNAGGSSVMLGSRDRYYDPHF